MSRSPRFLTLARWYARSRIRRDLDGLHVSGLEQTRALLECSPVILAANHVAWWDTLLLLPLDEALASTGHVLMDADSLRRLPFFSWLGAIPLDRSSRTGARHGLKQAVKRLSGAGDAVWIFPQGRQRPAWLRPLQLHPGVCLLGRLSGASIVPVSIQYGFREQSTPTAVVRFGAPLAPRAPLPELEQALCEGLARVDDFFEEKGSRFQPLIAPRGGRSEDGIGSRLLSIVGRST